MKLISNVLPVMSTMLAVAILAGCAAAAPKGDAHDHAKAGAMDMQSHCEMHKRMMGGKPSAEQQSMMQEHMKSMSPEMRQRMQAMHEQCK